MGGLEWEEGDREIARDDKGARDEEGAREGEGEGEWNIEGDVVVVGVRERDGEGELLDVPYVLGLSEGYAVEVTEQS